MDLVSGGLLVVLMFFQIFDLLLSKEMDFPFKGDVYEPVATFLDLVRIYPFVINKGSESLYWFF